MDFGEINVLEQHKMYQTSTQTDYMITFKNIRYRFIDRQTLTFVLRT